MEVENIYYVNLKLKHTEVLDIGAFNEFATETGVG